MATGKKENARRGLWRVSVKNDSQDFSRTVIAETINEAVVLGLQSICSSWSTYDFDISDITKVECLGMED